MKAGFARENNEAEELKACQQPRSWFGGAHTGAALLGSAVCCWIVLKSDFCLQEVATGVPVQPGCAQGAPAPDKLPARHTAFQGHS